MMMARTRPSTWGSAGKRATRRLRPFWSISGTRKGGRSFTSSSGNWRSCTKSSHPIRSCVRFLGLRRTWRMYRLVRANYDRGIVVDKSFLRKTARLVQEHTDQRHPTPEKVHGWMPTPWKRLPAATSPIRSRSSTCSRPFTSRGGKCTQEPYLISIGDKAEQIAQAFEERQQTTQETLEELERLVREMRQAQSGERTGSVSRGVRRVLVSAERRCRKSRRGRQGAAAAFEQHPHWQTSSHQEQEVRVAFYKALITAGIDGVVDVAQNIMRMLRRAIYKIAAPDGSA